MGENLSLCRADVPHSKMFVCARLKGSLSHHGLRLKVCPLVFWSVGRSVGRRMARHNLRMANNCNHFARFILHVIPKYCTKFALERHKRSTQPQSLQSTTAAILNGLVVVPGSIRRQVWWAG